MPRGNTITLIEEGLKLWKAITFVPEFRFGHNYSRWRALDEKKPMIPLRRDLERVKEK
jgi:hypothetical protein